MEEEKYSVFINKKEIEVSYLIFLCHCKEKINGIKTLDEYVAIGSKPLINSVDNIESKLNSIHTLINNNYPIRIIKSHKAIHYSYKLHCSSMVFLGLFYREFKSLFLNKSAFHNDSREIYKILNKIINYPNVNTSNNYSKLQPWLNFYWKLSIQSTDSLITIKVIEDTIKKIDPLVSLEDIKEDLLKHLIILPYKNNYVWSSKYFYKWLTEETRTVLQTLIWNKRLALSSINLGSF